MNETWKRGSDMRNGKREDHIGGGKRDCCLDQTEKGDSDPVSERKCQPGRSGDFAESGTEPEDVSL